MCRAFLHYNGGILISLRFTKLVVFLVLLYSDSSVNHKHLNWPSGSLETLAALKRDHFLCSSAFHVGFYYCIYYICHHRWSEFTHSLLIYVCDTFRHFTKSRTIVWWTSSIIASIWLLSTSVGLYEPGSSLNEFARIRL